LPSTLAVHRTSVRPMRITQEPSAWRATPGWMETVRSAPGARPDGLVMGARLAQGRVGAKQTHIRIVIRCGALRPRCHPKGLPQPWVSAEATTSSRHAVPHPEGQYDLDSAWEDALTSNACPDRYLNGGPKTARSSVAAPNKRHAHVGAPSGTGVSQPQGSGALLDFTEGPGFPSEGPCGRDGHIISSREILL
jgi:hypothetical protein